MAAQPQIRSRREWGAATGLPTGRNVALSQRTHFVVHWPGGNVSNDIPAFIRGIERQHRNQWAIGPGYNYLVGPGGAIWEGAGLMARGIHSPPHNTNGFGVCCLLSLNQEIPQAMRNSTRALYDWLCSRTGRRLHMQWHGANVATACPGPRLTQWVRSGMPAQGGAPAPAPSGPGHPAYPGVIMSRARNARHPGVRTAQQQLARRGWGKVMGAADGVFGPMTESAVRGFQRNQRIQCSGEIGPQTWPRLWTGPGGGPIRGGCS